MPEKKKHLAPAFLACFMISALAAPIAPAICAGSPGTIGAGASSSSSRAFIAQDDDVTSDENDVAPQDVDKYIKVYQAMQHDRNLTVEQATAQQGITVSQFRTMEDKIERNDALREHVRDALKPKAAASPAK
ncbi:MAG TPA: hypothetical protein VMH37_07950 [Candidatus Binataceae bacterium]|nr:hypothetical protein [Candidatus Binataceae bacterium]